MFYSWCWIDLKPSSFILAFPFIYILGFFWLGVEQWGIEEIFVFPQHVWLGGWKVKELKTNLFGWEEKWEDKKSNLYVWEPKMCGLAWQLLGMLGNVLGRPRHTLQRPRHALQKCIYIYIYIYYYLRDCTCLNQIFFCSKIPTHFYI